MFGLVSDLLDRQAMLSPERVALVKGSDRLTYGELDAAANRFAHALIDGGVKRGDRVAILLENQIETVTAIFGTFKAGAAIMMLHQSSRGERLRYVLGDASPTAFVSDSEHVESSGLDFASHDSIRVIVSSFGDRPQSRRPHRIAWSDLASYPDTSPKVAVTSRDLANLAYTSGSTGHPKGIISTHSSMIAAITSINSYLCNTADDVILGSLPLSSGYGLYQPFLATSVGARVVLDSGITFPARTVELMEQEGVTALPGVPTHFAMLLRFPRLLEGRLKNLRYLTNAGAGIPPSNVRRLRALLPHVAIFCMYGMAECTRVSYLPPDQVDIRPDSVGIAIPGTQAYVAGEDGKHLPPGEIGELVVRGPHVNAGYWRAPELTAKKFRQDPETGETVLYSGDLFREDADGFLYFVSRRDDIIKVGGEKVAPREVEDVVSQLDDVAEVAVIGVPDEILGDAVLLSVVPKPNRTLSERVLRTHCGSALEDHMRPKHIMILDSLPQLPGGKVDKRSLRDQFVASSKPHIASLKEPKSVTVAAMEDR